MQKAILSVVYHSQYGHTEKVAGLLAESLHSLYSEVHLIGVQEAKEQQHLLHASDTLTM